MIILLYIKECNSLYKNKNEKKIAVESRNKLYELIYGKIVILKNISMEKYGRILADVYLDDLHVNQDLLDKRYAVKYDGGHKVKPTSWLKYKETGIM